MIMDPATKTSLFDNWYEAFVLGGGLIFMLL
jgi:hypothetical protein